ncbi:phosphatidylinositol-specific phospholipase C [Streptomyces sp. NBC_00370]|uniref:phosphatidylinositol-specific phospholipase C n=1 Tax=Streptomyces sp. NBC_00370 TaxID=2975728 RepID=UPI002E25A94A
MTLSRRSLIRSAAALTTTALATGGGIATARAATAPRIATGPRIAAATGSAVPADWMGGLPDALSLLRMTIPGTHDSGCTDPDNGTEWSHTQNWGIAEQLQRGVRFLDIRANGLQDHLDDSFGIYHASYYQGITFDGVLSQCRDFLRQHPGETIVMRLKKENGTNNDVGARFKDVFDVYLDAKGWRPWFLVTDRVPSLGEARGRIVLIAQFDNDLPVLQWPGGDNDFLSNEWFSLQDIYQGLSSPSQKTGKVTQQFDNAAADQDSALMYINFTSYAGGGWPKFNADAIMPGVQSYLAARVSDRTHLGVVPMDFPDFHSDTLTTLIDWNWH